MRPKRFILQAPLRGGRGRALPGTTVLALWLLGCPAPAAAQAPTPAVEQADSLYAAQAWDRAASAYEALAQSHPENGRLWFRYGMALLQLGRATEAVTALEKAEAIGHHPTVMYNLACALARASRSDEALDWLEKAAAAGFNQVDQLDADPDLEPLRQDGRWPTIRQAVDRQARPCAYDEDYRKLDFWIGDWDVQTPQEQPAGQSHVEGILGGCVIFENWTGFLGMSGKSFNFIDPVTRQWKQTWVNDKGNVHEYEGEIVDGAMRFRRETRDADGSRAQHRMTLFPLEPGHVRQLGEVSRDGGATWSVQYDLHYFRREPPSASSSEP